MSLQPLISNSSSSALRLRRHTWTPRSTLCRKARLTTCLPVMSSLLKMILSTRAISMSPSPTRTLHPVMEQHKNHPYLTWRKQQAPARVLWAWVQHLPSSPSYLHHLSLPLQQVVQKLRHEVLKTDKRQSSLPSWLTLRPSAGTGGPSPPWTTCGTWRPTVSYRPSPRPSLLQLSTPMISC